MARFFAFDSVFFFLPFVLYALWLLVSRGTVKNLGDWQVRTVAWLALAGSGLLVAAIAAFISFSPGAPGGTYIPAHIDNGVIVPGHVALPNGK